MSLYFSFLQKCLAHYSWNLFGSTACTETVPPCRKRLPECYASWTNSTGNPTSHFLFPSTYLEPSHNGYLSAMINLQSSPTRHPLPQPNSNYSGTAASRHYLFWTPNSITREHHLQDLSLLASIVHFTPTPSLRSGLQKFGTICTSYFLLLPPLNQGSLDHYCPDSHDKSQDQRTSYEITPPPSHCASPAHFSLEGSNNSSRPSLVPHLIIFIIYKLHLIEVIPILRFPSPLYILRSHTPCSIILIKYLPFPNQLHHRWWYPWCNTSFILYYLYF
jgi:hypothetical protein